MEKQDLKYDEATTPVALTSENKLDNDSSEQIPSGKPLLNPQPSDDPKDPLNWPLSLKVGVLIQVCLLAGLGTLNTAIINPAYGPLSKEFGITKVRASYQT
ncbi:MAG: hypothetical protein Q9227_005650 [Pyrenula ochraceoflavens]